ncbi:neprilysin-21 [Ixodes scapularis]
MSTATTSERRTTVLSTMTGPQPRSWLDRIEESPNRRKIEVGLITSICLVLLIVLALTLFVVLTINTTPVSKAPLNLHNAVFCENATCFEQARRVMGYVEWSREPCDDFYTYACKGYHVSVAHSASKYPITQGAQDTLRAAVEDVLANWHADMKPSDNFYLRYGVSLFQECMQGVSDSKEQLLSLFADMTYNHKPFFLPKSFDLEPHTLASRVGRNFWFFPLITVRKDVDLENRQHIIVHLDEPQLTAPKALFEDPEFQKDYLKAMRDLSISLGFDNVNETLRIFKLEQMLARGTTHLRARVPFYKKVKLGSLFLDKWNIYMYLSNVLGENMSPEDEVALRSEKYFTRFLKALKTTEWGTVNNYIVFRLVQFLSPLLLSKDSKVLQFMYKYGHALRPPPSKRTRCLDALEPYFKPLLLTAAKITFRDTEIKRAEASRAIANLKESFKRMSVKSFYPHTEQSTLNNKDNQRRAESPLRCPAEVRLRDEHGGTTSASSPDASPSGSLRRSFRISRPSSSEIELGAEDGFSGNGLRRSFRRSLELAADEPSGSPPTRRSFRVSRPSSSELGSEDQLMDFLRQSTSDREDSLGRRSRREARRRVAAETFDDGSRERVPSTDAKVTEPLFAPSFSSGTELVHICHACSKLRPASVMA